MKRIVQLGFFLLGASTHAQENVEPNLIVAASKLNILYCGVDNPVELAVPGVPCDGLSVTVSGKGPSLKGCLHLIHPDCADGKVVTVEVRWLENKEERSASRMFRVKQVPVPDPYFGGQTFWDDSLRLTAAQAAQGVIARLTDYEFDIKITIEHYRLQLLRDCAMTFDGVAQEARLTLDMQEALRGARMNDIIRIEDIIARFPDGRSVALRPLMFTVH